MVCFWTTFILAILQAFIACLMIWRLILSHDHGRSLTGPIYLWEFINSWGFLIDCFVGAMLAPFALFVFAMARREGLRRSWPLGIWLISRFIVAAIFLACGAALFLQGWYPALVLSNIFSRLALFNLPIWLLLVGLLIIRLERQRAVTDDLRETIVEPPPIDPLA